MFAGCGGSKGGIAPQPEPPGITSFTADPATITEGDSAELMGVFLHGTGSITPGNLAATSGTAVNVKPAATTTYTLSVVNPAGKTDSRTTLVTVVAAPATPVLTAPATVTAGTAGNTAAAPDQAGCTFAWTILGGTFPDGGSTALGKDVSFAAGAPGILQLSCVSTNAAGKASAAGTWNVTVVAAPATPVIAAPANVTTGMAGLTASVPGQGGCTFAWTITGGTFAGGGSTATGNAVTFAAGAPGTLQLSCTSTNAAGKASEVGTWNAAVVEVPFITSFIASPTGVAAHQTASIQLTAIFSGGVGTVDHGVGILASGVAASTASVSASTTFNLTVTNAADMVVTAQVCVPVGTLSVLAGVPSGIGSVDGTGNGAGFNHPSGTAVDGSGNVYVADSSNHTIRMITPAAVVSTLAGSPGTYGSADGVGFTANFYGPQGLAVDGSGNVYVADTYNYTIRKITPGGMVSTLAGTAGNSGSEDATGTAASFYLPRGVAVDGSGNVYVADTYNHTIRKITPAGVVSTLAGTAGESGSADGSRAAARFFFPAGVAVDGIGNVYVADSRNYTIRKITPGGEVSTLAGTAGTIGGIDGTGAAASFGGYAGGEGPTAVAVDGSGTLYVTDSYNDTIRRITPEGVVTTVAGTVGTGGSTDDVGAAARFSWPTGVAVDGSGYLYLSDLYDNTIRKITPAGVVSTLAGTPRTAGGDDGVGAAATFAHPSGVAMDGSGNAYVADTENHTIRMISPAGVVSTLAGTTGMIDSLDGTGAAARFQRPSGLAVDGSGNVYVADTYNATIRKITPAGVVSTLAGTAGTYGSVDDVGALASFGWPASVAVDGSGNVYVADADNCTIRKITPAGVVSTLAGTAGRFGSDDGVGAAARFAEPRGVAVDASGNVYVADTDNRTIRKITPSGVVSTLAGTAGRFGSDDGVGAAASFAGPMGVALDASGNIYVADSPSSLIRKITPAGAVSTVVGVRGTAGIVAGTLPAVIAFPTSVAVDPVTGNLLITTDDAILEVEF